MANLQKPFGLSPWRNGDGSPWNGQANLYFIRANDTNAFFIGDPVKSVVSDTSTAGRYDLNGVPAVTKAAAGDTLRGVIVGVSPVPVPPSTSLQGTSLTLENTYVPATKTAGWYVWVADDPGIIFKAQMDNQTLTGSISLGASISKNCSIVIPSQTTGTVSTMALDSTTVATTSTLVIRIMGLTNSVENGPQPNPSTGGVTTGLDLTATTGQYAYVICRINQHELSGNSTAA